MARISGVNIPTNKKPYCINIHIWNRFKISLDICKDASIDTSKRVSELKDDELNKIRELIDNNYSVEEFKKKSINGYKRLNDLGCYRGLDIEKTPCKRSRTHTNARTRKGKAVAIAGKEIIKVKMVIRKKLRLKKVSAGIAHIVSSFNNTIITISDEKGNALAWSKWTQGFKGSRKSTPYTAQSAAEDVGNKAKEFGLKSLKVEVSGPGSGLKSALRSLQSIGYVITSIKDVTPIPHNGCRPRKEEEFNTKEQ